MKKEKIIVAIVMGVSLLVVVYGVASEAHKNYLVNEVLKQKSDSPETKLEKKRFMKKYFNVHVDENGTEEYSSKSIIQLYFE